jgi:hypothetical protein
MLLGRTPPAIVFSALSSSNFSLALQNDQHPSKFLIRAILAARQWTGDGEDPVAVFLSGIATNLMRPATAALLIDALNDFVERKLPHLAPDYPAVILADSVCRVLAKCIACRKSSMKHNQKGQLAKLGLLCDKAFVKETVIITADDAETALDAEERKRRLWNQRGYLTDHLFYLSNPQDSNSNIFLTFASAPQNRDIITHLDAYLNSADHTTLGDRQIPLLDESTALTEADAQPFCTFNLI